MEVSAVERSNRSLGVLRLFESNERETAGLAAVRVIHYLSLGDLQNAKKTTLGKMSWDTVIGKAEKRNVQGHTFRRSPQGHGR